MFIDIISYSRVLVVFFFIRSFFSGVEAEQGSNLRRKNKAAT